MKRYVPFLLLMWVSALAFAEPAVSEFQTTLQEAQERFEAQKSLMEAKHVLRFKGTKFDGEDYEAQRALEAIFSYGDASPEILKLLVPLLDKDLRFPNSRYFNLSPMSVLAQVLKRENEKTKPNVHKGIQTLEKELLTRIAALHEKGKALEHAERIRQTMLALDAILRPMGKTVSTWAKDLMDSNPKIVKAALDALKVFQRRYGAPRLMADLDLGNRYNTYIEELRNDRSYNDKYELSEKQEKLGKSLLDLSGILQANGQQLSDSAANEVNAALKLSPPGIAPNKVKTAFFGPGGAEDIPTLLAIIESEQQPYANREAAARKLGKIKDPKARAALQNLLLKHDSNWGLTAAVLKALLGERNGRGFLADESRLRDPRFLAFLLEKFEQPGTEEVLNLFVPLFEQLSEMKWEGPHQEALEEAAERSLKRMLRIMMSAGNILKKPPALDLGMGTDNSPEALYQRSVITGNKLIQRLGLGKSEVDAYVAEVNQSRLKQAEAEVLERLEKERAEAAERAQTEAPAEETHRP